MHKVNLDYKPIEGQVYKSDYKKSWIVLKNQV